MYIPPRKDSQWYIHGNYVRNHKNWEIGLGDVDYVHKTVRGFTVVSVHHITDVRSGRGLPGLTLGIWGTEQLHH